MYHFRSAMSTGGALEKRKPVGGEPTGFRGEEMGMNHCYLVSKAKGMPVITAYC
jgi:hypothetical protein